MLAPPLLFAALAALFLFGMNRSDPDQLPSAVAGNTAPPVGLAPLGDMATFDDASLRAGGVTLVNYWASWCAPCRAEHPQLEAMAAEGVTIYGINYKDRDADAQGFLAELGNPYAAIGTDSTGRTALDWGLYGVPETYVIDGTGKVTFRFAGPITVEVMNAQILPAIAAAQ
ncbi:Thiol:disulfide interchange protein CycY precursor [Aquimixticola soesokkakensis]|uniref:Thiol:disulfide interchange protein CycY n=1 Tax=Aquimixticola soesokkakensis TaxID=1519096 RepID=A0A1Y5TIY8_9RHOB|nr:Thiol:disulfide interchange protein CycY precursor [Aquimixticola soesokkakensis]